MSSTIALLARHPPRCPNIRHSGPRRSVTESDIFAPSPQGVPLAPIQRPRKLGVTTTEVLASRSSEATQVNGAPQRHRLIVLGRRRPRRLQLLSAPWVRIRRVWPYVGWYSSDRRLAVKWQRKGLRIYWRRRSRCPGRPKTSAEIRDLILRRYRKPIPTSDRLLTKDNLCGHQRPSGQG
jgi:hypothetical protein